VIAAAVIVTGAAGTPAFSAGALTAPIKEELGVGTTALRCALVGFFALTTLQY
jgi:hypothetical protein